MTEEEYSEKQEEIQNARKVNLSFPMTEEEFEENLIKIQESQIFWRKERLEAQKKLLESKRWKECTENAIEADKQLEEKLRSGYKEQLDKDDSKRQD